MAMELFTYEESPDNSGFWGLMDKKKRVFGLSQVLNTLQSLGTMISHRSGAFGDDY